MSRREWRRDMRNTEREGVLELEGGMEREGEG